jgi:hypothetical protein
MKKNRVLRRKRNADMTRDMLIIYETCMFISSTVGRSLLPTLADKRYHHSVPSISSDIVGCHKNNPILAAGSSGSPHSSEKWGLQIMPNGSRQYFSRPQIGAAFLYGAAQKSTGQRTYQAKVNMDKGVILSPILSSDFNSQEAPGVRSPMI